MHKIAFRTQCVVAAVALAWTGSAFAQGGPDQAQNQPQNQPGQDAGPSRRLTGPVARNKAQVRSGRRPQQAVQHSAGPVQGGGPQQVPVRFWEVDRSRAPALPWWPSQGAGPLRVSDPQQGPVRFRAQGPFRAVAAARCRPAGGWSAAGRARCSARVLVRVRSASVQVRYGRRPASGRRPAAGRGSLARRRPRAVAGALHTAKHRRPAADAACPAGEPAGCSAAVAAGTAADARHADRDDPYDAADAAYSPDAADAAHSPDAADPPRSPLVRREHGGAADAAATFRSAAAARVRTRAAQRPGRAEFSADHPVAAGMACTTR